MTSPVARDLMLKRVSRLTRWLAAAAIVGTGVVSAVVARAQPGRNTPTPSGASSGTSAATTAPTGTAPAGDSTGNSAAGNDTGGFGGLGLSRPSQLPGQSSGGGVVSSGAS